MIYHFLRNFYEGGKFEKLDLNDSYLIAYLRGGKNEVLRIITIALIEKKILKLESKKLVKEKNLELDDELIPIEKKVAAYFRYPNKASYIFSKKKFGNFFENYELALQEQKLLPNENIKFLRKITSVCLFGLGLGIGILRFVFSILNNHYNIIFLLILLILFSFIFIRFSFPRLTSKGKKTLRSLQSLVQADRFNQTYKNGKQDFDLDRALFISAIIGSSFISSNYNYAKELYPKTSDQKNWNSDSSSISGGSCGSGCSSSSCGSGCGGGCGGGD